MEDRLFIPRTSFSSISSRHSWLLPQSHPPVHATGRRGRVRRRWGRARKASHGRTGFCVRVFTQRGVERKRRVNTEASHPSSAHVMVLFESYHFCVTKPQALSGVWPLILQPPHSTISSSEGSHPGAPGRKKALGWGGAENGSPCFRVCTKESAVTQGKLLDSDVIL